MIVHKIVRKRNCNLEDMHDMHEIHDMHGRMTINTFLTYLPSHLRELFVKLKKELKVHAKLAEDSKED